MANEIKTRDAIQSLKPNAKWTLTGSSLNWLDSEQTEPTSDELAAEVIRLQAVYDAKAYQRTRSLDYPSIQDQLDMQYWDSVNGTTTWATAIAKVKTDNPKP